jgi:hypothetical protein
VALFGQLIECHVAQSWAATWHPFIGFWFVCKILLESMGFDPQTSPPCKCLAMAALPVRHALFLI